MNRCLSEPALLRLHLHDGTADGTAGEPAHLRQCAECAERYDRLVEDLEMIARVLEAPPVPVGEPRRIWSWRTLWIPVAIGCAALAVLALDLGWLRTPPMAQAPRAHVGASNSRLAAFAADLSDALFPAADTNGFPQLAAEAPYLEAALEAGQPCSRDRFLSGECNDEVSAFLAERE